MLSEPLFDAEADIVAQAVPKRVTEFTAGRTAVRRALAHMGYQAKAILRKDRMPVWPDGFAGSISHSSTHAGAIVALSKDYAGLGLDMEPDAPLSQGLMEKILLPEEMSNPQMSKLRFSIKEAGFKALYPSFGTFIGFHEARSKFTGKTDGTFEIEMISRDWKGPRQITGRWAHAVGHFVVVVALTPELNPSEDRC